VTSLLAVPKNSRTVSGPFSWTAFFSSSVVLSLPGLLEKSAKTFPQLSKVSFFFFFFVWVNRKLGAPRPFPQFDGAVPKLADLSTFRSSQKRLF